MAAKPNLPPTCLAPLCAALDEAQAAQRELQGRIRGVKGEMAELKTVLYAKFGAPPGAEGQALPDGGG